MSGRVVKRRRTSSMSAQQHSTSSREDVGEASAVTDEGGHESTSIAVPSRSSRFGRASSSAATAGLSTSSYNLPSRSYIHNSHGAQEPARYASGFREQTAELSSSLLSSDGEMARYLGVEGSEPVSIESRPRKHETIQETSEVTSPAEGDTQDPYASELPPPLLKQPPRPINDSSLLPAEHVNHFHAPDIVINGEDEEDAVETTPLMPRERLTSHRKRTYDSTDDVEDQTEPRRGLWNRLGHHYPSAHHALTKLRRVALNPKSWDMRKVGRAIILRPASMLPAVFLGVLLNLLDALSYGIILFPLGEEAFADMGPDGVSMFYVSCIISQLVYSSGSIFRGGVGSEMIEVVPFFHKMTYLIIGRMGNSHPDALRATVITSYAMSSIITGVVFLALGSARLGTLVNFFPHSILTGCIGGVGIFLFITGVEVSARLDGNLEFSVAVFKKLVAPDTIVLWIPPLVLAIILLTVKHFYDRPWLVPAYYIGITAIFYIITTAVPSITMEGLRSTGWVFQAPAAGVPFYNFYGYYKFNLVDWGAIWMTVPSQLALTFFGILHVPINVPNLALVVQEDNVSINRELIMHGISNTLSGCVGSIQNYLVFVNSVLFMNTGGNSRLAGYLLAAATFGLWVAGPVVIGYVPVMVVGCLIYMLGIDLTREALIATYGRLHRLEYFTIVIIALVMGIYDFVWGIAIGIGLACLTYVVQTSRKNVIRAEFSGTVAESTVRRHPRQRSYLHKVGPQIRVVKLGSYLFFGSIVKVEKKVRALIDAEAFAANPIRFLILDFSQVTGIDYSAAEAFGRMNRILDRRGVNLSFAGVRLGSDIGNSLEMVGLFEEGGGEDDVPAPKLYEDLNGALEACENELLMVLTEKQRSGHIQPSKTPPVEIPSSDQPPSASQLDGVFGSPRRTLLLEAATTTLTETGPPQQSKWQGLKQPLPLLLQAFQDLTDKNEDFWVRAMPYFTKREFLAGQHVYARGDRPDGFYVLQAGLLRAEYYLEQGYYRESIVAGTTCGELPFFSETKRTSSVTAERACVAWLLTPERWEALQECEGEVARELLKVGMKLSAERMNAITSYVLITAS